jgi:hypothetical protein
VRSATLPASRCRFDSTLHRLDTDTEIGRALIHRLPSTTLFGRLSARSRGDHAPHPFWGEKRGCGASRCGRVCGRCTALYWPLFRYGIWEYLGLHNHSCDRTAATLERAWDVRPTRCGCGTSAPNRWPTVLPKKGEEGPSVAEKMIFGPNWVVFDGNDRFVLVNRVSASLFLGRYRKIFADGSFRAHCCDP